MNKKARLSKAEKIKRFRKHIEKIYEHYPTRCGGSFEELLCWELHAVPVNPRMWGKTFSDGYETGLTFNELMDKWGIGSREEVEVFAATVADHIMKLRGY